MSDGERFDERHERAHHLSEKANARKKEEWDRAKKKVNEQQRQRWAKRHLALQQDVFTLRIPCPQHLFLEPEIYVGVD